MDVYTVLQRLQTFPEELQAKCRICPSRSRIVRAVVDKQCDDTKQGSAEIPTLKRRTTYEDEDARQGWSLNVESQRDLGAGQASEALVQVISSAPYPGIIGESRWCPSAEHATTSERGSELIQPKDERAQRGP
jgi:hypothetical protein